MEHPGGGDGRGPEPAGRAGPSGRGAPEAGRGARAAPPPLPGAPRARQGAGGRGGMAGAGGSQGGGAWRATAGRRGGRARRGAGGRGGAALGLALACAVALVHGAWGALTVATSAGVTSYTERTAAGTVKVDAALTVTGDDR